MQEERHGEKKLCLRARRAFVCMHVQCSMFIIFRERILREQCTLYSTLTNANVIDAPFEFCFHLQLFLSHGPCWCPLKIQSFTNPCGLSKKNRQIRASWSTKAITVIKFLRWEKRDSFLVAFWSETANTSSKCYFLLCSFTFISVFRQFVSRYEVGEKTTSETSHTEYFLESGEDFCSFVRFFPPF